MSPISCPDVNVCGLRVLNMNSVFQIDGELHFSSYFSLEATEIFSLPFQLLFIAVGNI